MPFIHDLPDNRRVETDLSKTILEVSRTAGIHHPCAHTLYEVIGLV